MGLLRAESSPSAAGSESDRHARARGAESGFPQRGDVGGFGGGRRARTSTGSLTDARRRIVDPPGSLEPVPFLQPESAGRPGSTPGSIDYRFARRQLLRRYRSGELSVEDVCDAQRELMRVALNCSSGSTVPCPVCGETTLRLVRFVFGPKLPPGGRPVAGRAEMLKLATPRGDRRCYTVEVCTSCRWNHLLQVTPLVDRPRGA